MINLNYKTSNKKTVIDEDYFKAADSQIAIKQRQHKVKDLKPVNLTQYEAKVKDTMAKAMLSYDITFQQPGKAEVVKQALIKDKKVDPREGPIAVDNATNKHMFNSFLRNHLKLSNEEVLAISAKKIVVKKKTTKEGKVLDKMTVELSTKADIDIFRNNMHNLDNHLVKVDSFVPEEAFKRWSYLDHLSYMLRQKKFTTKIRETNNDYLLVIRPEGDLSDWKNAASVIVPDTIPLFEVGKLNEADKATIYLKHNEIRSKAIAKLQNANTHDSSIAEMERIDRKIEMMHAEEAEAAASSSPDRQEFSFMPPQTSSNNTSLSKNMNGIC